MTCEVIYCLFALVLVSLGFVWATVSAIRDNWHVVPICCFAFCALATGYEVVAVIQIALRHAA